MKMKKILVWLILILSGFYVGAVTGVILVDLGSRQSIAPVREYILVGLYVIPLIAELILLPVVRRGLYDGLDARQATVCRVLERALPLLMGLEVVYIVFLSSR